MEKFFDRVNHAILMARVARKVKDKRVLKLIRRYLTAGLMEGGVASARVEGTPQGGPLSPLLSNILLTDLDRELESRGHRRLTETYGVLEEFDGWIRRKLRALLWRQWKRVYRRAQNLIRVGIDKVRAWQSATNGRGPWWNAAASHMNQAYPKSWFDQMGLVSLLDTQRRFPGLS